MFGVVEAGGRGGGVGRASAQAGPAATTILVVEAFFVGLLVLVAFALSYLAGYAVYKLYRGQP
jgi:hypothetical protein